jgi:hypothetical protein
LTPSYLCGTVHKSSLIVIPPKPRLKTKGE